MKVKTWDGNSINDGTNYQTVLRESFYGLPAVRPRSAARNGRWPVLAGLDRPGRVIECDIYIKAVASKTTLQDQLFRWFDPEGETAKTLVCEDDAGGNDRYVTAICQALEEAPRSAGLHYHAILVVDGDVRWREVTASTSTWSITSSGGTKVVANNGKDDAYPVLKVKPTSNKTGGYGYLKFVAVRWNIDAAESMYPIDLGNDAFDTAALVSGGKMQSDGDDLRVLVNGAEVSRWLDGMNTSTTKVWVSLDYQARAEATLGTAIASSGAITEIVASTSISGFPSSGIVMIDSEVFVYTGKVNSSKTFTGVTRATKGTSMAAHTTTDTIWWIQHEIYIMYGNSSATAPSYTDEGKPMFALASSTNTSWDYDEFNDVTYHRSGAWTSNMSGATQYTGDRGASANPWSELGVKVQYTVDYGLGQLQILNNCGFTNANFANGEKWEDAAAAAEGMWDARIRSWNGSSWADEDTIAEPSATATWESWSDNEALTTGSKGVALWAMNVGSPPMSGGITYVEAADVTLTLNSSNTPTCTIGSEIGNYSLDCKITNTTTGDAVELDYTMSLNDELELDTDEKTVVDLSDNSNQFQALTVTSGPRRDWLKLNPGNNTLRYDETGVAGVTVTITWEERYYQ